MIVVPDTSAWVELFRNSDHPITQAMISLLDGPDDVLLTECVLMEILAGARSQAEVNEYEETFTQFPVLRLSKDDFAAAARIYRDCRAAGNKLRSQIDCLIAVPAIKAGAEILHNDRDFETIARHTRLRIYPWDPD